MRGAAWVVVVLLLGASCGYPDLPRLSRSCLGLALTCGANGMGNCCDPADPVLGGTFLRGYDAASDAHNDMNFPATVSPFALDRYEVTVGRFRKFVEGGMGTLASPPAAGAGGRRLNDMENQGGWDNPWDMNLVADTAALTTALKCHSAYQTWTDFAGINENKAINCVTWYEAMAFCIWDGGFLLTEAEWNYAATGGDQQRAYPWSDPASSTVIDCMRANYYVSPPAGMYCVNGATGGVNRVGSESSTGGDGRWEHSDLAGNVWEWVLDWHEIPYLDPQTCSDCANLAAGSYRVIRGGSFGEDASYLRAANRTYYPPIDRSHYIGLRCARAP